MPTLRATTHIAPLHLPLATISHSVQEILPGTAVCFLGMPHTHWDIASNIRGDDGQYMLITTDKSRGKIVMRNFSEECQGRNYRVIGGDLDVYQRQEICRRAMQHIGAEWQYSLINNNCQHFVKSVAPELAKGIDQVDAALIGAVAGALVHLWRGGDLDGDALISGAAGAVIGVALSNLLRH